MLNFRIFFVSVNNKNPSDDFMHRFSDIPRAVKKLSASTIAKDPRMAVIDKSTHQFGIIFWADSIHWLAQDSAEVEGGYRCNGLCGAGITFVVKRENNKWVVKSKKAKWIS